MTSLGRSLVAWLATLVALTTVVATGVSPAAASSASSTVWLCRPGLANNPCEPDLTTTRYDASGNVTGVAHVKRAQHPKVDCFYVYPTVSDQKTAAADFTVDPVLRSIAQFQTARYSSECRVFAPVYRQLTLAALTGSVQVTPAIAETAYQDVRHAWMDYLQHDNHGHGVVFIGHSQGSFVLRRLLREEIDPHASVRKKLVSAILLGGDVTVKKGKDVGGDFQHIPACRSSQQVGCVVAFSTFDSPVPTNSLFGRTADPTLDVLCTNPTSLGGGSGEADAEYPTAPFGGFLIALATSLLGLPKLTATTPWVEYDHAYRATCSSDTGAHVLQVTPLGKSPLLNAVPNAQWGLHLADANIALGNLVKMVHTQSARWGQRHHHGHAGRDTVEERGADRS